LHKQNNLIDKKRELFCEGHYVSFLLLSINLFYPKFWHILYLMVIILLKFVEEICPRSMFERRLLLKQLIFNLVSSLFYWWPTNINSVKSRVVHPSIRQDDNHALFLFYFIECCWIIEEAEICYTSIWGIVDREGCLVPVETRGTESTSRLQLKFECVTTDPQTCSYEKYFVRAVY